MVKLFWQYELEPDDYVIPLLSAIGDIFGTGLLVSALYVLIICQHVLMFFLCVCVCRQLRTCYSGRSKHDRVLIVD